MSSADDVMTRWAEINARSWNMRTPTHIESDFYDLPAFLGGKDHLTPLEIDLCGDVRGLEMLHLQCHFGLDTLAWARRGAHVTGIDFSETAIDAAREIAAKARLHANFVVGNVLNLSSCISQTYDLAISTYGALCWLPSLEVWAQNIARCLRPGGRLVVVEFHPILDVLFGGCLSGGSDYFGTSPTVTRTTGTYATRDFDTQLTEVRWAHPIGSLINAVAVSGMRIRHFVEHPFCVYPITPCLDTKRENLWWCSTAPNRAPFMFSLVAEMLPQ